jgi:2-C-methyl-D-erythritol 4-phosphate cytidylyltransferase
MNQNWIIVTAGGKGTRMMAGVNKIFLPVLDIPIIIHTLKTLENHHLINKVVITVPDDDLKNLEKIIKSAKLKKVVKLIPVSGERQQNTLKALRWIKKNNGKGDDLIGVHNAVNPLVIADEIEAVFRSAEEFGGALLAYPAKDTTKICDEDNCVVQTPVRKFVWSAQTPQVGRLEDLLKAFEKAENEDFLGTDDTQLLERIGIKVKVVQCSKDNFKITYPEDIILAEKILKEKNV